jgi:hypothetical protein
VLEALRPDWKPRIEFAVPDVRHAAEELRNRGIAVQMKGNAAVVIDPDGVAVVFR